MRILDILSKIKKNENIYFHKNKKIKNICLNSNEIKKGDLFISLKGSKFKGNSFIKEAIDKGSAAIITDTKYKNYDKSFPIIYDSEIKKKLPNLLSLFYKPIPKNIISITGTNGKTSVGWYVHQMLLYNNINSSYLGTIGEYYKKNKISDQDLTTPDICSLFQKAYNYFKKDSNYFIFELSSHGIHQKRIKNFPINYGAITNITRDHLDYHKSLQNYKKVKLELFTKYLQRGGHAIINSRIKFSREFKKILKEKSIKIISYGSKNSVIFIKKNIEKYTININNKKFNSFLKFKDDYNIENIECACAILFSMGIPSQKIVKSLKLIDSPPGRMEICEKMNNKSMIFVDFAHTPDALNNILDSSFRMNRIKPNLVFGCGGDRDRSKRILMGKIANLKAENIYITDDNPRSEDSNSILLDILKGCPRAKMINNRREAIRIAINKLEDKQTLIIAGKGHEKYQIIKGNKFLFDDVKTANDFIKIKNNYNRKKNKKSDIIKILKNFSGSYKINSKDIRAGDIFIALKGSKTNGNEFIEDAVKNKAKFIITDTYFLKYKSKILLVDNVIESLQCIAKYKRSKYKGKVIAVTGSAGKTSTKEQLKFFLSFAMKTYASIKSYNNVLGVNLSLANLDLKSSVAIFEIGTSNFGEIGALSTLVKPHISIITNVGPAHLKYFKKLTNILKEKFDIFNPKYNSKIETIILPFNIRHGNKTIDKLIKKNNYKVFTFGKEKNSDIFICKTKKIGNKFKTSVNFNNKIINYQLLAKGEHQIKNSLITIIAFNILNLNINFFTKNALYLPELKGRGDINKRVISGKKIRIINETYNANPLSMKETIKYYSEYEKNYNVKKILLLGDMLELGYRQIFYHKKIKHYLDTKSFYQIITYGSLIENLYLCYKNKKNIFHFNDEINLYKHLIKNISKNTIILAKSSNSTDVNKFISRLLDNKLKGIN